MEGRRPPTTTFEGRQKAEDGGQRAEDGRQRTEGRGRRTEDRGRRAEDRGRRAEGRGRRTDEEWIPDSHPTKPESRTPAKGMRVQALPTSSGQARAADKCGYRKSGPQES
jgi:hypothetical protein